jgi:hypothetical protein
MVRTRVRGRRDVPVGGRVGVTILFVLLFIRVGFSLTLLLLLGGRCFLIRARALLLVLLI